MEAFFVHPRVHLAAGGGTARLIVLNAGRQIIAPNHARMADRTDAGFRQLEPRIIRQLWPGRMDWGLEAIQEPNIISALQQRFGCVGADEAGAACDQNSHMGRMKGLKLLLGGKRGNLQLDGTLDQLMPDPSLLKNYFTAIGLDGNGQLRIVLERLAHGLLVRGVAIEQQQKAASSSAADLAA